MNSFAHQEVGQADTRGQHPHPNFTALWLGAFFLEHLQRIGPTVVGYDDACVFHEPHPYWPSARPYPMCFTGTDSFAALSSATASSFASLRAIYSENPWPG